ncbi:MAG: two-component system sensor histidine kinase NtrB [Candidatus Hodarchaeales archaeon]|jgi:signal transduction histidine kinase
MGIRIIEETTQRASNRPYLVGIFLSLSLFVLWLISDYLVFGNLASNLDSGLLGILEILRGLANAIVIAFIIMGFSTFISRVENIKQLEQLTILNNMHDGLIEVSNNGIIMFANDQIKELLELPDSFILEKSPFDSILPIDINITNFKDYLLSNDLLIENSDKISRNKEISLKTYNDNNIPVLASATYLDHKNRFLLVFTGIKELRKAQKQVQYLMHVEKVSALGHLVAGIGHEVNNPLSFLINDFDRLKGHINHMYDSFHVYESCVDSLENKFKDHRDFSEFNLKLEEIKEMNIELNSIQEDIKDIINNHDVGLKRITKVVRDLRQYSSMGSPSKKDIHQLNDIISLPLSLVKEQFADRITFKQNLDPDLPELFLNPDRMAQVVMNIVLNSIQAIDEKGSIEISSYFELETSMVCLEITDTGSGINKNDVDKIFDPYFTTKLDGTGLGLGIVKNIIDDHNGSIKVESEINSGTKLLIKLPKTSEIISSSI